MAIKFGRPIEMRDTPRREATLSAPSLDLAIRPRRNRKAEWARPWCAKTCSRPMI